jgi:hypothetical protein
MENTISERNAKLSASALKRWNHPGEVNAQSIRMQQMWCDPAFRKRHQESIRNSDRSKNTKGSMWITNGTERRRILPDVAIPDGWQKGKEAGAATKPASISVRGSIWITDGVVNKRIVGEVPEGWKRGRA